MSSRSDDDPTKRFSTEHYSRVAADLDWSIVLGAASSISFGFILNITINPTSYFQFLDNIILLAALYAVTVATAMFIMPVIHHSTHYRQFDVEKFLLVTKGHVLIGYCLRNACHVPRSRIGIGFQVTNSNFIWFGFFAFYLYFP